MEPSEKEYILQGWQLKVQEVSNGVYEITLTDPYKRKAGTKDHIIERGIRQCAQFAFDIEKQITQNWNKFLYGSAIIELGMEQIVEYKYEDHAFGSWFIVLENQRIVLDGKENLIISQSKPGGAWVDDFSFPSNDLTYDQFLKVILNT